MTPHEIRAAVAARLAPRALEPVLELKTYAGEWLSLVEWWAAGRLVRVELAGDVATVRVGKLDGETHHAGSTSDLAELVELVTPAVERLIAREDRARRYKRAARKDL